MFPSPAVIESSGRCIVISTNYCYGPFHSRRLGLSLGVNVLFNGFGSKRCTYSCVYCEIGRTMNNELTGPGYIVDVKPTGFREELTPILRNLPEIQSVTFGYNGEPTLNPNLVAFLEVAQEVRTSVSGSTHPTMTVFTNSSTVTRPEVQGTLRKFDLVLAKLDVGTQADFQRIYRPHLEVPPLEDIVMGLRELKAKMPPGHTLALQSLFLTSKRGAAPGNASPTNVAAWAQQVKKIQPDLVQVYTVAREPAEKYVCAIPKTRLEETRTTLLDVLGPGTTIQVRVY